MYLSQTTHSLVATSNAAATTTEPQFAVSYQNYSVNGMDLLPLSGQGSLTGTSEATLVAAPAASKTTWVKRLTISNVDTVSHTITVFKDVSGANTQIIQAILASGNTLVYSDDGTWSIFTTTGAAAGTPSYVLREYNTASTWTKPAALVALLVSSVGAGGGGGSGTRQAAGTNRFGGSGGGGGAVAWRLLTAAELAASYAVSPGAIGVGGTAISVNDTIGNVGSAGGDSSFGGIVIAKGGFGGAAGNTSAPAGTSGGSASTSVPAQTPYALAGATGGAGQTTSATSGGQGYTANGAPGGAGGGGISNANTSSVAAYNGGAVNNNNVVIAGPAFNANGADNQSRSLFFHPTLIGTYGLGTGGGGGRPGAENGGDGGDYGAGGGGGSGVLNGTVSGKGGDGGLGLISVLEIY